MISLLKHLNRLLPEYYQKPTGKANGSKKIYCARLKCSGGCPQPLLHPTPEKTAEDSRCYIPWPDRKNRRAKFRLSFPSHILGWLGGSCALL